MNGLLRILSEGEEKNPNISLGTGAIYALVAIIIVFAVLLIIIFITSSISKGMELVDAKTNIQARPENKVLDEDKDAAIALIAATIDFQKETGKDPRVVSIKRIEE